MKKAILVISLLNFIIVSILSQSCLPEGIIFLSQDEVNAFPSDYPGCTEIEGDVFIGEWGSPTDITNLDSLIYLTAIGGNLDFTDNPLLDNLNGLQNLTTVGGYLNFLWNDAILDFTGLNKLNSVGGSGLWIYENSDLVSLNGLQNIDPGSIVDLWVCRNPKLEDCNIQAVCDYLLAPNGVVTIYGNDNGCNSPPEVAEACGNSMSCLPFGNYWFMSQSDVDNFQTNYGNCTSLEGDVHIGSLTGYSNISDLTGLSNISEVLGKLNIVKNSNLLNLNGLDQISQIGESLVIQYNDKLPSLSGLNSIKSIGGNLWILDNAEIGEVSSLINLNSIGGDLWITNNWNLSSLYGLDSIDAGSISTLFINNNINLTECEVRSVCDYIASGAGTILIINNNDGCNSEAEVEAACELVTISDYDIDYFVNLYPNPASNKLKISSKGSITEVIIYTLTGKEVIASRPIMESIDISSLQTGMYIVEVMVEGRKVRQKLIVE